VDVLAEPDRRSAVAQWLVTKTGQAVEERADGTIVSFALDRSGAETLVRALHTALGEGIVATTRELTDVDWSREWRRGLGARRLGRLTIVPSWIEREADAGTTVVLDPEMAFGSGEHGSTRAALVLLDRLIEPGDFVLDLGSGSGILSIAAAKLGASRVVGLELDQESNPVAERNAERNGVSDCVSFLHGDAAHLAPLLGPADLVLSNILRSVNQVLLPVIASVLRPGRVAIFSGMEVGEASAFLPLLPLSGFEPGDEATDDNWWAVAARRQ
jgi:ribosomal protein L11 methyltransferase